MAHVNGQGHRRWQGALAAGLLAVAGTQSACGSGGSQTDSAALSAGETAAAARALAISEAEIARRARVLLSNPRALAYVEALASNFESASAAIEAAAAQLGVALTPGQTSRIIDAYLDARRAWLDAGVGSDAAFFAQLAEDLTWLLDLLNELLTPATPPPELRAPLERLRDLIETFRDLADALAREFGIIPPVPNAPDAGAAVHTTLPSRHPRHDTSWGPGPSRNPGQTGTNFGTAGYQQK
ncbi:MAG TPA: hypothetical protein VGK67_29020 [Myxococcales bacterium]|jgi:predicted outer membrane protein